MRNQHEISCEIYIYHLFLTLHYEKQHEISCEIYNYHLFLTLHYEKPT